MSLILIENHPSQISFRPTQSIMDEGFNINDLYQEIIGSINLVLNCKNPSSKGKGVDVNNRFPWSVCPLALSRRLGGKNGFSLHVSFYMYKADLDYGDAKLTIRVEGDFMELLQYVFNQVPTKTSNLKMNFCTSFRFQDESTATIPYEMAAKTDKSGNVIFKMRSEISAEVNQKFVKSSGQTVSATMTIELLGRDLGVTSLTVPSGSRTLSNRQVDTSSTISLSNLDGDLEAMNRSILDRKLLADYALVADTGKVFRCNKIFLAARSALFEALFQSETEKAVWKQLKLSEEGVEALLKFLYCSNVETPEKHPDVALDLLEIAIELQIPSLEKSMKDMIIRKPDDWLIFEEALSLFLRSTKLDGYEEVKRKAVRAIKLHSKELKKSAVYKKVCATDPALAAELLSICR